MVVCNLFLEKFTVVALLYPGGVAPRDCTAAVASLKARCSFDLVEWYPTGLKLGSNY